MKCWICGAIIEEQENKRDYLVRAIPDQKITDDAVVCWSCCEKEILRRKTEDYSKKLEPIFTALNRMGTLTKYDSQAIAAAFHSKHRYLQNEALCTLRAILAEIGKVSGDSCYEDPRNQWGLSWAKKAGDLI